MIPCYPVYFLFRDTVEDSIANLTKLLDSMEGKRHLKLIRPMSGGKSRDKLFFFLHPVVLFTELVDESL